MSQVLDKITANFSAQARVYDGHARIQEIAASSLTSTLATIAPRLTNGPVLELGCGTGLLTEKIACLLDGRQITASDLSPDMVSVCRSRMDRKASNHNIHFQVHNGENALEPSQYALIISSFALQWFFNLEYSLRNLYRALLPGGMVLFSLPSNHSFPEWKESCRLSHLPFTGNRLPSSGLISRIGRDLGAECDLRENSQTQNYDSSLQFFTELKYLGAATRISHDPDSQSKLLRLIRHWDATSCGDIRVTYQILTAIMYKPAKIGT